MIVFRGVFFCFFVDIFFFLVCFFALFYGFLVRCFVPCGLAWFWLVLCVLCFVLCAFWVFYATTTEYFESLLFFSSRFFWCVMSCYIMSFVGCVVRLSANMWNVSGLSWVGGSGGRGTGAKGPSVGGDASI